MYLKEGDIGKAESEEVVPVKTETEMVSQAGSAGTSPGTASWLLPHGVPGLGADCRRLTVGRPQGELHLHLLI